MLLFSIIFYNSLTRMLDISNATLYPEPGMYFRHHQYKKVLRNFRTYKNHILLQNLLTVENLVWTGIA